MSHLDETYIRAKLESAGKTLAMLPRGFGRPQGVRSAWPETLKEIMVFLNEEGDGLEIIMPDVKEIKPRPSLRQVTELELVLDWIVDLAAHCKSREITHIMPAIWLGMLHHPVTGKRIYSWHRLGKKLGCGKSAAQRWYADGIRIISRNQSLISAAHKNI